MSEEPDEVVEVLRGDAEPDLWWIVTAGGSDEDFATMLYVFRGDRTLAGSGFRGPKLYGTSLLNEWRGRTDDLPWFVMARTTQVVTGVVAVTDKGSEVDLVLSPVIDRFGLRFAAGPLPYGERPGSIRAERDGIVVETVAQPTRS